MFSSQKVPTTAKTTTTSTTTAASGKKKPVARLGGLFDQGDDEDDEDLFGTSNFGLGFSKPSATKTTEQPAKVNNGIYNYFKVALNRLRAAAQNNLLPPTYIMSCFGVV